MVKWKTLILQLKPNNGEAFRYLMFPSNTD